MSDDFVVEIEDSVEVETGLYLAEIKKMSLVTSEKTGLDSIVINGEIVDGPFKGAQFSDWITLKHPSFSINEMNKKRVNSFMTALAGNDDFEKTIRFQEDAEGQRVNPAVVGLEVGVYLRTNKGYLNVDRGGYVPASAVDAEDTTPFE